MLTLEDVPGFSLIRVHPVVKIGDTGGCPLPGLATDMDKDFNFSVGRSREALKRIHRILDPFFVEGEMDFGIEVWWEVYITPSLENRLVGVLAQRDTKELFLGLISLVV